LNLENGEIVTTIGGDHSISVATISALNEKYENLMILYIDPYTDVDNYGTGGLDLVVNSVLMGHIKPHFIEAKKLVDCSQYIFFGLDKDAEMDIIDPSTPYFTLEKIRDQLGIDRCVDVIKSIIKDRPLYVSLDAKIFDKTIAPSTDEGPESGLMEEDIKKLLIGIKESIVGMDITEYNPHIGSIIDSKKTRELLRRCLIYAFDIQEKSINCFNEDSEFLIYRPLSQEHPLDTGWLILRGMSILQKEEILKTIETDQIINLIIDGEDYLITKTTMNEQYQKTCYGMPTVNEAILFPSEKEAMCFEMING